MNRRPNRTWLAVSQVCSSVSNVLIVFAAAALLPTTDLGVTGLAFAGYLITVSVVRGVIGEPALLNSAIGEQSRDIAGGAFIVGALMSLVVIGPLLAIDPTHRHILAFCTLLNPILCVQDALRYAAFAQERPCDAGISDVVWVVGSLLSAGASYFSHEPSVTRLLVGWSISGALATGIILRRFDLPFSIIATFKHAWRSLFQWRRLRFGLALESIATSVVIQIAALQVTQFGGLAAGGIARIVQTAHGPATLIFASMYVDGIWSANRNSRDPRLIRKSAFRMAIALAFVSTFLSALYVLIPRNLGQRIAGETFLVSRGPMLVYAVAQIAAAFGTAAVFALRLLGLTATRIRLIWAALVIATVPIGATRSGASGYFVALALANTGAASLWWLRFRVELHEAIRRAN
jgi:hypothetical protein